MSNTGGKIGMKLLTVVVGIPIGIATRKVVEKVWIAAGPDRPQDTKDEGFQWADAISWAALTGMGMALADLLARKGAEEIWRTVVGSRPPVTPRPTASKRVRKAEPRYPGAIAPPS